MRIVLVLCLLGVTVVASGCRRTLFDENLPRHQFEDYDAARQGNVPTEEPNEFGELEPNLRKRLGGR